MEQQVINPALAYVFHSIKYLTPNPVRVDCIGVL
jgi:hypothetical protein